MERLSLLQSIEKTALEILKSKDASSKDAAILLPEVVTAFKEKQFDVNESTLSAYLSKLTRSGTSAIKSAGKKKGFFFSESSITFPEPIAPTNMSREESSVETTQVFFQGPANASSPKQKEPRLLIEKKLYQMIKQWLETEDYNVDVTADKTANGKWGNPDVTGIKVVDTVSENKEVEIITIEVKPNLDQWKQFIFEAVSHTRFANLTYYCFAYPESDRNSLEPELYLYAEEYGLGLLGIEMEQDDYEKFQRNEYDPKFEEVEIIELQTPRLKFLRPYFREKFLNSLGISSLKELILWPGKVDPLKPAA